MANDKSNMKQPTSRHWDRIRALYMRDETLDYIVEYMAKNNIKVSKRAIVARMNKEGISERRKAIRSSVLDNMQESIQEDKIKVNEECIHLFETGSKVIKHLLHQYLDEVKQEDVPKSKAKATAYNVDMLMSGATKIQKGLRVCYGMDETGKLYEKEPEVLVIDGLNTDNI